MGLDLAKTADRIQELEDQIGVIETAAAAKTAPLKDEMKGLEEQLMLAMSDAGLVKITGNRSEAKISRKLRVSIQDFDALQTFVIRKKALHLFERRISTKAFTEMKESLGNKDIPGLSSFEQPALSVKPLR